MLRSGSQVLSRQKFVPPGIASTAPIVSKTDVLFYHSVSKPAYGGKALRQRIEGRAEPADHRSWQDLSKAVSLPDLNYMLPQIP